MMEVTKSEYDDKEYRAVQLDNGLKVLLVHKPSSSGNSKEKESSEEPASTDESLEEEELETSSDDGSGETLSESEPSEEETDCRRQRREKKVSASSACAVCIKVGSFCDSPEVPGLAHLVEHMVFMGSEKYPEENSFDMYCSKHGGYTDANTDYESSVYYFTINKKYFTDALDRFAHFFISPLLRATSLEREIEAVDNEFQESIQSDSNRLQQLMCSLARPDHPLSNFSWGNLTTLKKTPKKKGIDVVEHLKRFHRDYYSASYMTAVLVSEDSLDSMEEMARDCFATMPSCNKSPPSFENHQPVFEMSTFHRIYKVLPAVKDKHQLRITWILPCQFSNYRVKPMCYLGWLLGHEGNGSVISYLRKRQLAGELVAGNGEEDYEYNSSLALFSCTITLTELGVKNILECLTCVFQYLKMLRDHGPQERIFKEIQTTQENEFNFFNEEDAQDTAERLCLAMQYFPPTDYLTGNDIMYEYDPQVISSVQELLVPDRCNIMILSREYNKQCNLKEKWFGTRYSSEAISQEWEDAWKDLEDNPELHLPQPNPFIATDLAIKDLDTQTPHTTYPVVIDESDKYRLWFKQDNLHNMPIATARFLLKSQLHIKSVKNVVLMELFLRLYRLVVIETVYDAEVAHLESGLSIYYGGIAVIVNGLSQKLPVLFKLLVRKLIDFDVSELLFETVKEELSRGYLNFPLSIKRFSSMLRTKLLVSVKWTAMEKHSVLDKLTREDLMSFFAEYKKQLFVEALIQGNILAQEAKSLMEYFVREWEYSPVTFDHTSKVIQIPANTEVVLLADNMDPHSPSNAVTNLYQCSVYSARDTVLLELLVDCMSEPCFDELRTKQQLGYDVSVSDHLTVGVVTGLSIKVITQAKKFSVDHVSERINQFLLNFKSQLNSMSEEDFASHVSALKEQKLEDDVSLDDEIDRNWQEVVQGSFRFNHLVQEAEALSFATKSDVCDFFDKFFFPGQSFRKLSIQVVSQTGDRVDSNGQHCLNTTAVYVGSETDCQIVNISAVGLEEYKSSLSQWS